MTRNATRRRSIPRAGYVPRWFDDPRHVQVVIVTTTQAEAAKRRERTRQAMLRVAAALPSQRTSPEN